MNHIQFWLNKNHKLICRQSHSLSPLSTPHNTEIDAGSLLYLLEWAIARYDLVVQFEESGIDTCAAVTASVGTETRGEGDELA